MSDGIIDLQLARLRRLPKDPADTWQGDLIRLPTWLAEPGQKPVRLCIGFWISAKTELIGGSDPELPGADPVKLLVDGLTQFACDRRFAGTLPGAVEVKDAALADGLRSALEGLDVEVRLTDDLPLLSAAVRAMAESMAGGGALSSYLDGEGVTVEGLRAFAEAAAAFYRARPWLYLEGEDLLQVEAPDPPPDLSLVVVTGKAGLTYGMGFPGSRRLFDQMAAAEDPREAVRDATPWTFAFEDVTEMPFPDSDLWEEHALPLAGEEAYPMIAREHVREESRRPAKPGREPKGRRRRERDRDLEDNAEDEGPELDRPDAKRLAFLEGLLRALALSTEDDLDEGRWEKTVSTFEGEKTYRLALPLVLEAEAESASRSLTTSLETAHDLVAQAFEEIGRRRIQLARRALRLSSDCVDAYVIQAEEMPDAELARALYQKGVEAGKRVLGPRIFEDAVGNFWGLLETRPYMRALLGYASSLDELDRREEAARIYEEALRLNPNDNQGARYLLARNLLERDERSALSALLVSYADDAMAVWKYTRSLLAFREDGDAPASRQALETAFKANPHVPKYLIGRRDIPLDGPEAVALGSDEEAVSCAESLMDAWTATPGAVEWLDARWKDRKKAAKTKREGKSRR